VKLRVLLIVAAFLLLPAGARATEPAGSTEGFVLHGSHHYEIVVRLTNRRRLEIGVVKEKESGTHRLKGEEEGTTTYEVTSDQPRGSADIDARVGGLGRIDADFVPSRTRRIKGCEGPKQIGQIGHFVGTIEFHGEGGYTSARVNRTPGVVIKVPRRTCHTPKPRSTSGSKPNPRSALTRSAALAATATGNVKEAAEPVLAQLRIHRPRDRVQVTALGSVSTDGKSGGLTVGFLLGSAERHLGPVREWGLTLDLSFKSNLGLRLPKPLEPKAEAVLSPPPPFSGAGTFRHHPGTKPTWTGDLALELPGFGRIALTGPEIHAALCEGPDCAPPRREPAS
jgi:hypothetical protein